ncbi:MAG: hypothetical protein FWG68_06945 [Defluviitaleaceae bacterium]|nr:hypothetical protein [Defluviitaleaceae bacterium]
MAKKIIASCFPLIIAAFSVIFNLMQANYALQLSHIFAVSPIAVITNPATITLFETTTQSQITITDGELTINGETILFVAEHLTSTAYNIRIGDEQILDETGIFSLRASRTDFVQFSNFAPIVGTGGGGMTITLLPNGQTADGTVFDYEIFQQPSWVQESAIIVYLRLLEFRRDFFRYLIFLPLLLFLGYFFYIYPKIRPNEKVYNIGLHLSSSEESDVHSPNRIPDYMLTLRHKTLFRLLSLVAFGACWGLPFLILQ